MAHRSDVADVNAANAAGDTLLHIAAGNGHELCYLSRDMWCYSTRAVRRDSSSEGGGVWPKAHPAISRGVCTA